MLTASWKEGLTREDLASLKITKLTNCLNFWKWERDLKISAKRFRLWSYYTAEGPPLKEPNAQAYYEEETKRADDKVEKMKKEAESSGVTWTAENEDPLYLCTNDLAENRYGDAMEAWKQECNNRHMALTLLRLHVNDSIRYRLYDYQDAYEAFKSLSHDYRLSDHQTVQRILDEIHALELEDLGASTTSSTNFWSMSIILKTSDAPLTNIFCITRSCIL
ncbi:uncharacterized protein BDV14DRAFT_203464 [Aspergillus stella-maris]|uniref:uncharacterized protein n=1 Tax=Aspergillus stella-maris TaxID=1810926 RepID=UPI003CCD8957